MLPGLTVTLWLGRVFAWPAPPEIVSAIQSIHVEQAAEGPAVFQITFAAGRSASSDYALLESWLLEPYNRVVIMATVRGSPEILIDGVITNRQLTPGDGPNGSVIAVSGSDVSALMDMTQWSFEFPCMPDEAQVLLCLLKSAYLGLIPIIVPSFFMDIPFPTDRTPVQHGTDLAHIRLLANKHGFQFWVKPGPAPLTNYAYWGPPVRIGPVAPTLSVDMGPDTNVRDMRFTFDATRPTFVTGLYEDTHVPDAILPIVPFMSMHLPPLAVEQALYSMLPFVRNEILDPSGRSLLGAWAFAQGITNSSTDSVLQAYGEVDTLRYGAILRAHELVNVRGVGWHHDGMYYIESVTHDITRSGYRQSFALAREGYGAILSAVPA